MIWYDKIRRYDKHGNFMITRWSYLLPALTPAQPCHDKIMIWYDDNMIIWWWWWHDNMITKLYDMMIIWESDDDMMTWWW